MTPNKGVTRISHVEIGQATTNFSAWWSAKTAGAGSFFNFGYSQAVRLGIYKFHKSGSAVEALNHFDALVQRLTNASRIAEARLRLESYLQWCSGGVIVADHKVRLALPLGGPDILLSGEVSRVDSRPSSRYRAVLLADEIPADWREEVRMPLIQRAVAAKFGRPEGRVSVAMQSLDGSILEQHTFSIAELDEATAEAFKVAARIRKGQASKP